MNRRPPSFLLSKAIQGFLQFKTAEARSPRTLESYKFHLQQWLTYSGDSPIKQITPADLRAYLVYLRTDYKPQRFSGQPTPLAAKTIRNVWITPASFFSWLPCGAT